MELVYENFCSGKSVGKITLAIGDKLPNPNGYGETCAVTSWRYLISRV